MTRLKVPMVLLLAAVTAACTVRIPGMAVVAASKAGEASEPLLLLRQELKLRVLKRDVKYRRWVFEPLLQTSTGPAQALRGQPPAQPEPRCHPQELAPCPT